MEFTKKSVVVQKFGGYNSLEITQHVLPDLNGKVEVKVAYCSLNFADIYTRLGLIPRELPFVLGIECAGVITALGCSNNDLKVGDKVICYDYKGGMFSNIIRVPPNNCYKIPDNIDLKDAAALFVNYLTAYFSLFELGNLREGQTVFIPSCAGGVGWAATQLARSVPDVIIYGTCTAEKEKIVRKNGVDYILFYEKLEENILNTNAMFDIILESQLGKNTYFLESRLNSLGKIIMLGSNGLVTNPDTLTIPSNDDCYKADPFKLIHNSHCIAGLHLGTLCEQQPVKIRKVLDKIINDLHGIVKPRIDSIWTIEEIVDATKRLADRKNIGKVLCTI